MVIIVFMNRQLIIPARCVEICLPWPLLSAVITLRYFIIDSCTYRPNVCFLCGVGPSKAQVECTDNHDGTCTVDYTPTKPGDYDIFVKFAGEDIPGKDRRLSL